MKTLKKGDIVEIPFGKKFAYGQYIHDTDGYGEVLGVFNLKCDQNGRPDTREILQSGDNFICLLPLKAIVRKKIFTILANSPILKQWEKFPVFRNGIINPETGKVDTWWLWDGVTEWEVGKLKKKYYSFPLHEVINDTMLIERLCSGWKPEDEI